MCLATLEEQMIQVTLCYIREQLGYFTSHDDQKHSYVRAKTRQLTEISSLLEAALESAKKTSEDYK